MADNYRWDEKPQGQDFQGGAPSREEGARCPTCGTAHRSVRHERLAQLGAHVLEILREWSISAEKGRRVTADQLSADTPETFAASAAEWRIILAARSLGLLEEKGKVQP